MSAVSLNSRAALLLLPAILVIGCNKDVAGPFEVPAPPPRFAISDAAHSGGIPHFFFLPPIVSALPPVTGTFDPTLAPTVRVCEWTGTTCGALTAEFTTTSGTGGQSIRVDATYTKSYWVVWDTRQCLSGACTLDPTKAYRLRVFVGAAQLGFADVKVVTTVAGLKAVDRTQFAPVWQNLPYLIAFRVEQGAVTVLPPVGGATVGSAGGVLASADGQVALAIPAGALTTATAISMKPATGYPAGTGAWSSVVDLGPTGTTFATPATLTLGYDPTKLPPGVPPTALSVYTTDGTGWQLVPGSTVNAVDNTVSVPIAHFSTYTLTIAPTVVNGAPSPTTINVGQATTLTGYVFSYHVVPTTFCYPTGFPRHLVCVTYTNTYSYPLPNQAVSWTALPTGTQVVSLALSRTYTDQTGATTSPPITGRSPGTAQIVALLLGSAVQSTPVTITVRACVPSPSGLVSWWPGEGNANDIVGGNNGVLHGGVTFAPGKVGQAFVMNGTDGYVDAGNAPNLQVSTGEFTVEAWVFFNALSGDMSIVDKMSASGVNTDGWRLLKQSDNRFWFCLGGGATGNRCFDPAYTVFSTTVAQTGVWYHVAAVKSASGFAIYVNGVQEDARSVLPNFLDTQAANLRIGSYVLEGAHLNGAADEVSIYNRALTAQEIQTIYAAGGAGKCPGSVAPSVVWQQSLSGTGDVWSIATGPGGLVFVATNNGIYRSTDDGVTWTLVGSFPSLIAAAVGIDPATNDVYAGLNCCGGTPQGVPGPGGGGGSGVYVSTDNGGTWSYVKGNPGAFGFAFTSNGSVIAATTGPTGAPGGLFLSTDRGASWAYADCCYPRSFAITTNGNIFAGDTYASGGISRSTDQGANWTQLGLANTAIYALAATTSDHLFAGTVSTGVLRSSDGVTWTSVNSSFTNPVTSLAASSAGNVFAGGFGGGVIASSNDGATWTQVNAGLTDLSVEALAISRSGYIFAGTSSGVFRGATAP